MFPLEAYKIFREKFGSSLSRKILASPYTYSFARRLFLKRTNYSLQSLREVMDFGLEQTAEAYQGKKPVAWITAFFPTELVHALGMVPFTPEIAAASAAALNLAPDLLHHSHEKGFSSDGCSFHRCAGGGALEDLFPLPHILLASSHLCDGAPQLFRYLAQHLRRPLHLLDVPALPNGEAETYLAGQLEKLCASLEETCGIRLNEERLREALENSNRARSAQIKLSRLRREKPSPIWGSEGMTTVFLFLQGEGHARTAEIWEGMAREAEERLQKGIPGGAEKHRLVWLHLKPFYANDLIHHMENNLGMKSVCEEFTEVFWEPLDPHKPFLSLARKILSNPSLGPANRRLHWVLHLVRTYEAQGVVHFSHWGCRQAVGGTLLLKEKLRREGIPFLSLDGDCVDARSFPPGQALTRLESFAEMLSE